MSCTGMDVADHIACVISHPSTSPTAVVLLPAVGHVSPWPTEAMTLPVEEWTTSVPTFVDREGAKSLTSINSNCICGA